MSDSHESSGVASAGEAVSRIDQIADAALRLFARFGYKRSSMDDIAREAGLAKATLYLHFKGKDDVFRAMLGLIARRIDARCREVMALDAPFAERLAALLDAHYGQAYLCFGAGEHLAELKAVMSSLAMPELQALERGFAAFAGQLRDQAEARGEIAPARAGVAGADWIAGLMFAAVGAKYGEAPSSDVYAARLEAVARVFAATPAV